MTQVDVERLLEQALTARTAGVVAQPDSLRELSAAVARDRRRRLRAPVAVLAAAAAVVSIGAGGVLLSGTLRPSDTVTPAAPALAAREAYLATQDGGLVVVAQGGQVLGPVPDDPADRLVDPVLAPDASQVFAVWDGGRVLGSVDLATGERRAIDERAGWLFAGLTVSADGSTLAYETYVPDGGQTLPSIIVRELATGTVHEHTGAHGGAQVLGLALSPDGATLAVTPTHAQVRPLLLAPAREHDGLRKLVDLQPPCPFGRLDQPRWSAHGLFVYLACAAEEGGPVVSSQLLRVDPDSRTATPVLDLPATPTVLFTVVGSAGEPVFVVDDATLPDASGRVTERTADGRVSVLERVAGLVVGSAQ